MRKNAFTLVELPAMSKRAFTLVELLVVVAIIAVLLALLVPAMQRAIYQAELAVCGAQLHGIGVGVDTYAIAFKRQYPNRTSPFQLALLTTAGDPGTDDRPLLRDYISIKPLNCPLIPKNVNIESDRRGPITATAMPWVSSSYALCFGFSYAAGVNAKPMRRLGDDFTYGADSYKVLAMDTDGVVIGGNLALYSHPDFAGPMATYVWDNETDTISQKNYIRSLWSSTGQARNPIDNQYLYTDGSVVRLNAVKFNDPDPRIGRIPEHSSGASGAADWMFQIPKR